MNNWGRWGADDELGTLNLVDARARLRGAAAVRTGTAFSLGLPLSESEGIQVGLVPGRVNPSRTMVTVDEPLSADPDWIRSSEDVVTMALQCATHWDALAHVSYGGRIYNGYPADTVTEAGASRCGVHRMGPLVSRGVLLDVARALGQEPLPGGYAITPADLDRTCERQGVEVLAGDVVLVRTGHMVHLWGERTKKALLAYAFPAPGLGMDCARWLRAHDVAAVATDTLALEVFPCEDEAVYLPVHLLHLVEMGLTQGQNFVLDALAEHCRSDGRYTFLFDGTPLPFTDALGSPVNPVALK